MATRVEIEELKANLEKLDESSLLKIEMYAKTVATSLQGKAQKNAKWTDRTGDARKRLKGTYERSEKRFIILLSHGVDYGVYLEFAHEKNFAILWPTISENSENILKGLEGLMDNLLIGLQ